MRERYRFIGRRGDRLFWEIVVPTDSRVEQISCSASWFYAGMVKS